MSTMIPDSELKPEHDPLAGHSYKLEMNASRTALVKVQAHKNPTHSMLIGRTKLLSAALITIGEELRDRELFPETFGEQPHIPNIHANEKTREAKSSCELAIGHLEIACLLLTKAAEP